jgi:hypothetical protein
VSRRVRRACAFLALSSLLWMSALAGVTALHVLLEHHGSRDTAAHAHGVDARATDGHHHPHAPGAAVPAHSHPSPHDLRHAEAPEHDHVLVLAADLRPCSGRSWIDVLAHGLADAIPNLAPGIVPAPLSQPSRASPAARAAPLSRRSVVLRV